MIIAAGAPAEQVAINVLVLTVLVCRCSEVIPLVLGELPIRRGGTADVLQVALREIDLVTSGVHAELAVDGSLWSGQLKVGHQGMGGGHFEGIGGVGGNHIRGARFVNALGPVHEGIAIAGRGDQRKFGAVVDGATSKHVVAHVYRAAFFWIDRNRNRVALQLKVRHQVVGFGHLEGIFGIRGDLGAVLRPVHEVVALVGRRRQRTFVALEVDVGPRDRTALCRFSRGRDGPWLAQRGEAHRLAIHRSFAVGDVGTHVVRRVLGQARQRHRERPDTRDSSGNVVALDGQLRSGAPAHPAFVNGGAAVVRHLTANHSGGDVNIGIVDR